MDLKRTTPFRTGSFPLIWKAIVSQKGVDKKYPLSLSELHTGRERLIRTRLIRSST